MLKCLNSILNINPQRFYTGFRFYGGLAPGTGARNLFYTNDFTTDGPENYVIDLEVFTGSGCPYTPASTSPEPVNTPPGYPESTSAAVSSSSLLSSTLVSFSATSTPDATVTALPSSSLMSATSASASATPTPSADSIAVPENFCLKVLTPNVKTTDWIIKQSGLEGGNGAYLIDPVTGGAFEYVARFHLDTEGVLRVTTPGSQTDMYALYIRPLQGMFRYNMHIEGTTVPVKCSVKTNVAGYEGNMVLKCVGGPRPQQVLTEFRDVYGSSSNPDDTTDKLYGTDDLTTNTETSFRIELGLFTGGVCPDTA